MSRDCQVAFINMENVYHVLTPSNKRMETVLLRAAGNTPTMDAMLAKLHLLKEKGFAS